jgi:hypothetical protein
MFSVKTKFTSAHSPYIMFGLGVFVLQTNKASEGIILQTNKQIVVNL